MPRPSKERKRSFLQVSSLLPEQIRALDQYEEIVNRIRVKDPEAAASLTLLQELFSEFRKIPQNAEKPYVVPKLK